MSLKLQNKNMHLTVETPGEVYRGCRFDWNGSIISAQYHGKELLGEERTRFHRNPAAAGRGMMNEFGAKRPIGYDDAGTTWFPKIGTGWLKKDNKPYYFTNTYEMDLLEYTYTCFDFEGQPGVAFCCTSGEREGYSYRYQKTITLEESGFVTRYELTNLGDKVLSSDEYVHNFLAPGGRHMNHDISLHFAWQLNPPVFDEYVDHENVIRISENKVYLSKEPSRDTAFFLGVITGSVDTDGNSGIPAQWCYRDEKTGLTISETGNFQIEKADVWGMRHVISPELFYAFTLTKGQTASWERRISVNGGSGC